jgi:indole-3-glycerol phosphate synthase
LKTADFLVEIIEQKRRRLDAARREIPLEKLRARAESVRDDAEPHAFKRALCRQDRVNVIAEIKRASPSKGLIRADVSPAAVATEYATGGAAAISVLTEEDYFRGSLADLRTVRAAVTLPLLRKDFVFDEYQLHETANAGADAVLLIVAALDRASLARLRRITEDELGMDAMVEAHTAEEMRIAFDCGATLLGINNRDLRTFTVSLDVSVHLARELTAETVAVSESGIRSGDDIRRLRALGYRGFLIGEELMRAAQPAKTLAALIKAAEH